MAYNKHTWEQQELITAEKLNNLEIGVAENQGNGSSYQMISVDNNRIFDLDKVDYVTTGEGYQNLVLTDIGNVFYSDKIVVVPGSKISFSVNMKHLNGLSGSKGTMAALKFYKSDGTFISQKNTTPQVNSDWTFEKIENITVPDTASYVLINFLSYKFSETSNILKVSQPMLNSGSSALPFTNDENNMIKNPTFEPGLEGWYPNNTQTLRPNVFNTYLEVEPEINNYRIESTSAVTGTLPDGLGAGSLGGAFLAVRGSSVNGVGGVTQSLEVQGKIYQRTFSYGWSDWQVVNGVYGSFDNSGVWHSVYGDPVVGGVVYSPQDDHFYALDLNGKTINTIGYVTAPTGERNKEQIIKLKEGGVVDYDMSDSDVANDYVETVNGHLSSMSNPTVQMIVTDTHGTSTRTMMKNFNKIFTGYQYNDLKNDGTITTNAPAQYVDEEEARITHSAGKYYKSISRKYANDSSRNIKLISDKFSVKPNLYTHLGDVEDGDNYSPEDERIAYEEASSVMKEQGFKFIDGNHDEQTYYSEAYLLIKDGKYPNYPTSEHEFSRRTDYERYKESYNENNLYFSVNDDNQKIKYIYLDIFEGGRVKNKKGSTPAYGVKVGSAKLSANQIHWLVSELENLPDDWFVVVNSHYVPDPSLIGATGTKSTGTRWWPTNVNPDVLAGIMIAFQTSGSFKGSSNFKNTSGYDYSAYKVSVDVDFTNRQKDRVIVWNYGHMHQYGHATKEENGHFNMIQHPNLLGGSWSYIGNPSGSQFSTQNIDTENRKVTTVRFAPTNDKDSDFTLDF